MARVVVEGSGEEPCCPSCPRDNARMGMNYKNLDKQAPARVEATRAQANEGPRRPGRPLMEGGELLLGIPLWEWIRVRRLLRARRAQQDEARER